MATDLVGQAPAAAQPVPADGATTGTDRPPRRTLRDYYAHWSLRQRVARWFIALVLLLLLAFGNLVFALVRFTHIGDEVIDRWNPAFTVSQLLVGDLVNQETGLRGFGLTAREPFLQPYIDYHALQSSHEKTLRGYINGDRALLSDLDAFDAAVAHWRATVAVPYIAAVRAGSPAVRAPATLTAGKAEFDNIRAKANTLTVDLRAVREARKSERRGAIVFCIVSAVVAGLLTIGSKGVLWRGLRRSVLEPIESLGADARTVADGALDKKIVETGPPEIAQLGRDVDTMRARLVNELARIDRARVSLIERGEELARSNADLEQFAYVASHDLSEPLRKVANFCQLLERQYADQLDDKARQYIAFAVDGAKRMQVLIGDLLAFSRVGRTTETFAEVDTERALDRALATLEERITSSAAQIERGELPTLPGDPTLLTALFQNLVGNALKYRDPDQAPHIRISAERKDDDTWLFTVSDNGIGIDKQYAERIFTIFQRLHLRDKYGGTGIGLALCRKIVEFHRGRIWLGDSDGPGATFLFTLPAHVDTRDPVDA